MRPSSGMTPSRGIRVIAIALNQDPSRGFLKIESSIVVLIVNDILLTLRLMIDTPPAPRLYSHVLLLFDG